MNSITHTAKQWKSRLAAGIADNELERSLRETGMRQRVATDRQNALEALVDTTKIIYRAVLAGVIGSIAAVAVSGFTAMHRAATADDGNSDGELAIAAAAMSLIGLLLVVSGAYIATSKTLQVQTAGLALIGLAAATAIYYLTWGT